MSAIDWQMSVPGADSESLCDEWRSLAMQERIRADRMERAARSLWSTFLRPVPGSAVLVHRARTFEAFIADLFAAEEAAAHYGSDLARIAGTARRTEGEK